MRDYTRRGMFDYMFRVNDDLVCDATCTGSLVGWELDGAVLCCAVTLVVFVFCVCACCCVCFAFVS